ncbi:hypothetical protein Anas_11315 [Armadillidium nasatum]|uniref:Uncharacterized protein n=1 Tax=Armadillidium nasatum TaxID=96803 RepID=A0A5N5T9Z4_9CRUS|nr:hypothetical protein Anas_11315 [Armadillidium nasatum]
MKDVDQLQKIPSLVIIQITQFLKSILKGLTTTVLCIASVILMRDVIMPQYQT